MESSNFTFWYSDYSLPNSVSCSVILLFLTTDSVHFIKVYINGMVHYVLFLVQILFTRLNYFGFIHCCVLHCFIPFHSRVGVHCIHS